MKKLLLGLIIGLASPAIAQDCSTPVWDRFCVGMTSNDVRAAYGKDLNKVEYQYSLDFNFLNTGKTLSDVTVKFDATTPDAIVAQRTHPAGAALRAR